MFGLAVTTDVIDAVDWFVLCRTYLRLFAADRVQTSHLGHLAVCEVAEL